MGKNKKNARRIRKEDISKNDINIPLTAKVGEKVYVVCLEFENSPNGTIQIWVDGIGSGIVEEIQYDSRDEKLAYMVIKKSETKYCYECKRNPCFLCVRNSPVSISGVLQELIFPSYEKALETMEKIKSYDWSNATVENWYEIFKGLTKPEYPFTLCLHLKSILPNQDRMNQFGDFVKVFVREGHTFIRHEGELLPSCCEIK